ncbi:MAG: hypothetical protein ACTSRZ_06790 [Promethearchaeota archaeon]
MSDLSIEEQKILAKFTIANNLMSFTIYHNREMDILFEFISPIMKPNKELLEQAHKIVSKLDLVYTETKTISHPSGFILFVYEGNRIRISIIMLSKGMEQNVVKYIHPIIEEFAEDLEDHYSKSKALKEFDGRDKSAFKDLGEFFEKKLNLDLMLPHYCKYVGFEPENKLEQYIYETAEKLTRKIGYFYLPNLLYATKQHVIEKAKEIYLANPKKAKKEGIDPNNIDFPPNEQFYIAMFNLRKMGMLIPIQIKELRSFSKIKYPKMVANN